MCAMEWRSQITMLPITYEITATVDPFLIDEYERFMAETHISDLMATGHFNSAIFSRSEPGRYRIRYEAKSRDHLDQYLDADAPRLRDDVSKIFPNGVQFAREEWVVLALFDNESPDI